MSNSELVPTDLSMRDLREEVNNRTCRAGYTTREGAKIPPKIMVSVPCGKQRLNIWARDKNGKLIGD